MSVKQKQILKNDALKEIYLSSRNPIYFIKNYCWIQHPHRGLIKFDLYSYQEDALKNFLAYDKNIVNKARQLGFSTLLAAFIVWLILFHNDKSVLVVSTRADVARNLVKKVKTILKNLPDWMYLADVTTNAAHTVGLSNGSWVKSVARGEDVGRSEGVSLLVIDEAAHIRDMEEIWKGLGSTTSAPGAKTIALSTPKGVGNWFYKYCRESQSGENSWHYQEVYWHDNPEYSKGLYDDPSAPGGKRSPWFNEMTEGWTRQQIAQELLTSFTETGDTFLDPETIKYYDEISCEPLEKRGLNKELWIWKYPQYKKNYIIGADVSSGTSDDFSTAMVLDPHEMEIVAEWKGKLQPDLFAEYLNNELGPMYNNALLIPENNLYGQVTVFALKKLGYQNMAYIDDQSGKLVDKWVAEYKQIIAGFRTDAKTRPIVLAKLEEFLRKKIIKSYSKRLVNELLNFIWKNGKSQARKYKHDDLIIALAIAVWVRDSFFSFESTVTQDVMAMYDAVAVSRKTAASMLGDDRTNREKKRIKKAMDSQTKLKLGNNVTIDLGWIYKS